jgi:hypothetical protein
MAQKETGTEEEKVLVGTYNQSGWAVASIYPREPDTGSRDNVNKASAVTHK